MKGVVQGVNVRVERTIRSASGRCRAAAFWHFFFSFPLARKAKQAGALVIKKEARFLWCAAPGHLNSQIVCACSTEQIGWFRRGLAACLRVSGDFCGSERKYSHGLLTTINW